MKKNKLVVGSIIAGCLVVALTACTSASKKPARGLSFLPPEDEYAVSGRVLSKSQIYTDWSRQLQKTNPKLYTAVEGAIELSKNERSTVHVNRTSSGNYYLTVFASYGAENIMMVENNEIIFNHYDRRDGPTVEATVIDHLKQGN